MIEKIDMGAGSGISAISGDSTVEKRAKILQIPNAVEHRMIGNICGVAKYAILKANDMPNLAKSTNTAIKAPSALKKITRKIPPIAASTNEIMKDSLTPKMFMTIPEPIYAQTSAMQDKLVLTKTLPGMYFK